MKERKIRYRLSPNEEALIIKEETERRRKLRLKQVREQAKQNAAAIRQAVSKEKDRLVNKFASDLQNQLEKEKEEKVRKLEAQYENCLKSIGQGHTEAGQQVDKTEELKLMRKEDNRRADLRGKEAIKRMKHENIVKDFEENQFIEARKSALEVEKERATKIASLPAPEPDPVLNIPVNKKKPIKMTDADAFCTTHFHMAENVAVEKAAPEQQEDARLAAKDEEIKTKELDLEMIRLRNDRLARARVRHNHALEKEMLDHDYDNILLDLSDLQRADRERRQRVVAKIPKQVFEPPHRRLEDREDKQKAMEEAFEDMYMADTKYLGDLSMALDPHPPPATPTITESLEVSMLGETPILEPHLNTLPTVLKDMTNTQHKQPADNKKPEKVLRKLMDKIKSQRQEWMSKSSHEPTENDISEQPVMNGHDQAPTLSEYSLSESGFGPDLVPSKLVVQPIIHRKPMSHGKKQQDVEAQHREKHGPLLHPVEVGQTIRQDGGKKDKDDKSSLPKSQSQERTVDAILQQQNEIDPIFKLLEYGTELVEQKRQLEAKLRELEQKQEDLSKSATIPASNVPPTTAEQLASSGDSSVHLSSAGLVARLANIPKSTGFYGVSELPFHLQHSATSPRTSENPQSARKISDASDNGLISTFPNISQNLHYYPESKHSVPVNKMNGMSTSLEPPLPVGAYLSSAARQHPTNYLPSSVPPVPQTVSGVILPDKHSDQVKKIKDYQQALLKRHEESKKVLADTRAEIEQRRQELLSRFPQLQLKSPESEHGQAGVNTSAHHFASAGGANSLPGRYSTSGSVQENQSSVSSLLSRLASHPYYVSKLSQPGEMQNFTNNVFAGNLHQALGTSFDMKSSYNGHPTKESSDKVRKSLPFDESLQESPFSHHFSGNLADVSTTEDEERHGGQFELDESQLSSSTDRGSPALPGRKLGKSAISSDSETDTSFPSDKDARTEMFERRQEELRRQLAGIQRQKKEILHQQVIDRCKLIAQRDELKGRLEEAERRIEKERESDVTLTDLEDQGLNDTTLTGNNTGLDSTDLSSEASPDLKSEFKQLPTVARPSTGTLLGSHKPHDLSTIQEVDTPASTHRSRPNSDARSSLSGSEHSSTRRSLDFNQHPVIEEEVHTADMGPSPTNRRTVGDTGYFTGQIAEVLARARELDPTILDKLKQQTNDVFTALERSGNGEFKERGLTASTSLNTLSGGSLSPSSLSAGPLEESNTSLTSQGASDFAFKVVPRRDDSMSSSKSWADELAAYQEKYRSHPIDRPSTGSVQEGFRSLQQDRSSMGSTLGVMRPSENKSGESDLTQYSLSGDERTRDDSSEKSFTRPDIPGETVVDRKYDVLRFTVPENSQSYSKDNQFYPSLKGLSEEERSSKLSMEKLAEYLAHDTPRSEDQMSSTVRSSGSSSGGRFEHPGIRRSPLGHLDMENLDSARTSDSRTRESMSSSVSDGISSASSYMDLQLNGRSLHDLGHVKLVNRTHEQSSNNTDKRLSHSSVFGNFDRKLDFTSTPYTQKIPSGPATEISPESDQHVSGDYPSGIQALSDVSGDRRIHHEHSGSGSRSSGEFSKDSDPGRVSGNKLSQYTLKSDTEGITLINKDSPSQYPLDTENFSAEQSKSSDQFLSQYSMESSRKTDESSQASLTQITLTTDDLDFSNKADNSSFNKTGKTRSTDLSQYSLTPDVSRDLSNTHTGTSLSQYSMADSDMSDDGIMEKKFANLDNLIKESQYLMAKHKEVISRQEEETDESDGASSKSHSKVDLEDHQGKISDLATEYGFQKTDFTDDEDSSATDSFKVSVTTGSSFNVTGDTTPLRLTQDSATIVTSSLQSEVMSLDQFGQEAGISEEPNLTLLSLSANTSMNQSEMITPRSEGGGSGGSDSTLSFEQHEASISTEAEHSESAGKSGDSYDFSSMKPLYLTGMRSFKWTEEMKNEDKDLHNRSLSPPKEPPPPPPEGVSPADSDSDSHHDSGGEEIFHAVPVVISPSMSLAMKFDSSKPINQPTASWKKLSDDFDSGSNNNAVVKATAAKKKSDPPEVPKKSMEISARKSGAASRSLELSKPVSLDSFKSKQSVGDRKKAFESRSSASSKSSQPLSRSVSEDYTSSKTSKPSSETKRTTSVGALSLGEFLKSQKDSESKTLKSVSSTGRPKSAPMGAKKDKDDGGVVRSVGPTGLSKTLSSWKKSRSVKSAAPPPKPVQSKEMPGTAVKVLPRQGPPAVSESEEKKKYDRNMRLCSQIDDDGEEVKPAKDRETQRQAAAAANRDKVKEFQRKLDENLKKKQAMKRQQGQKMGSQ